MAKPIINKIIPFDATNDYTFSFSYVGNQPYKNRIIISDASTNSVIKDETVSEMRFQHTIAANTLSNGASYIVQFTAFDENNVESAISDKVLFQCYSTPVFHFLDLGSSENYIKTTNYGASIVYTQSENRKLQQYKFYLYDASHNMISESYVLYATEEQNFEYTYKNLDNKTTYYIRCIGKTVDEVNVDTGFVKIFTNYVSSNYSGIFEVSNNKQGGYVQGASDIVSIDGVISGEYKINNGEIDLTNKDTSLKYDNGFLLTDGHKVGIKAKSFVPGLIWSETNSIKCVRLLCYEYKDSYYFKLEAKDIVNTYVLYSELLKLDPNTSITIYITKENELYQLNILQQ